MALLPALRDDLQLTPAAPALDGAPQWTLADALSGQYFKLNVTALRLLRHWRLGDSDRVLVAANREAGLPLGQDDLDELLRFLRSHDLIAASDAEQRGSYAMKAAMRKQSLLKRALHQYLFFRIPLWRPDRFLNRSWPLLQRHGVWLLAGLMPLMLLSGLFLVSRDWPRYTHSFSWLFSLTGAATFGVALVFAKFIHELGHAYMAKRAGCRVRSMGVAFIVMFPMFYTDVSDAWRVQSHRTRLLIGAGGILAELLLAVVALLAWSLLPDGPLHTAAFLLSSATWVTTVLVNINPLMRFDGYFMLSDLLRVDNLQGRAFALCRWHLRERLFGYGEQPPERWSPRMSRRLLTWGYASWLWRFFLFMGIALTVYHYFFKVLGIFLMMVEVAWFIGLPVIKEVRHWWQQRQFSQRGNLLRSGLVTAALLLVLFVPWKSQVTLPAVLEAEKVSTLYAPVAAQLLRLHVQNNQPVQAGQLLLELASPDLEAQLTIARQHIAILQLQLKRQAARQDTVADALVLQQELAESLAQYRGLAAQQQRLQIRATADGQVRDLANDLTAGRWLAADLPLLRVVSQQTARLRGYLPEEQLNRLATGETGRFIADDAGRAAISVRLTAIAPTGASVLDRETLASDRGGPIAVRRDDQSRPRPVQAWYSVEMEPEPGSAVVQQPLRGVVLINGHAESLFSSVWRRVAALGLRESGF